MKVYTLRYQQIVNENLNDVFNFFSNPENLSKITPKRLDFHILTPKPIQMYVGQLIDYRITLLRKKIRWRTIITKYNPPYMFVDQQLKGPYSMWHHLHEFKEVEKGVEIVDTINYVIPLGILGHIINDFWVRKDLNDIFNYRQQIIREFFKNKRI